MFRTKINAFFNPEQFQGWGKTRNYFEGWYFKVLNADASKAFAFIPGIAMDAAGKRHAFIQLLDGKQRTSQYHKFEAKAFQPTPGAFSVAIHDNHFSESSIRLDLPDAKGELQFTGNIPWPKPWYSPGIMGPFAFVPFMECYHGIVSMDHDLSGNLEIGGEIIDFSGGKGYLEKDWGRSFPSAYVWMQSNHFSEPGISLKASVAKIPWVRSSFVGFISGVWLHDRLIRFTTYNQTHLRKCDISTDRVEVVMENRAHRLSLAVKRDAATELASPIQGAMQGKIEESMTSEIEAELFDKRNKVVLLHDTGRHAGLEVAGKIEEIRKV